MDASDKSASASADDAFSHGMLVVSNSRSATSAASSSAAASVLMRASGAVSPFGHVTKHLLLHSNVEFVSGYVAACTSITLLFPVNKLIFRQILDDISFRDALRQLRSEGLHNVYRGMLPPLLQKSTSYSVMFGIVIIHLNRKLIDFIDVMLISLFKVRKTSTICA